MRSKSQQEKVAVYPGSFDPVTYGHIDVIDRSLAIFDRVIVAVANNTDKKPLFSLEERLAMAREVFRQERRVTVESFNGLLVDYLARKNIRIAIRGLRALSDFEYEFQMALTNRKLKPKIETIFLMPREEYFYFTSSLIKELARFKADISSFVPDNVAKKLRAKFIEANKANESE